MHLEGVLVDEDLVTMYRESTEAQLSAIRGFFNQAFPYKIDKEKGINFNPGSPKQKQFLLHQVLGLPVREVKRSVTVDKNYLKDMIKEAPTLASNICQLLLKYSQAQKDNVSATTPLWKGRMHTKYGIGGNSSDGGEEGTVTGRLNSRATDLFNVQVGNKYVPVGTNLQNRKKGFERAMLIPNPGEIFIHCDLWAAEAFFVALDARELSMLQMLNNGIKLHNWMLDETTKHFASEVAEAGYDYKKAKQTVHSLNYAVEPGEMSRNSGLPMNVSNWQYTMYHQKFPGIKRRMARIEKLVYTQRVAVSPLGRQLRIVAPLGNKGNDPLKQAYAYGSQSAIGELTQIAASYLYGIGLTNNPWCFPASNAYDGLAIRCKKEDKEAVDKLVINAFNIPFEVDGVTITIPIELAWGNNYGETKDVRVHFYK